MAINNDLMEYMETKIYLYTQSNFTDYLLWTVFQEDFKDFTLKLFTQIQFNIKMGICKYLVKRGVYIIKQDKRYSLGKVLTNIANEKKFHE